MPYELLLQGGALALLGYLLIWATKTGFPRLVGSIDSVTDAIHENTASLQDNTRRLESIEAKQEIQTTAILRLVDHHGSKFASDEAIHNLRNQTPPP